MPKDWSTSGRDLDLYLDLDTARGRRAGLEEALRDAIRVGRLAPRTALPSTRSLAQYLGFARGTVSAAYDQLVAEGYLITRRGSGTMVADVPPPPAGPAGFAPPAAVPRHDLRPGRPDLTTRLYVRAGRSFRFPNTDELFGFDPITYATIFRGDLKPQEGTNREIGAYWNAASVSLHADLYRTDLTDEIAYDGTTYTNVNLPATRHQGLELDGHWRLSPAWSSRFAYTYTDATYRRGADAGKRIPSVPRNHAALTLTWHGGRAGTWSALVDYTGPQRYSGDDANLLATEPGYTTVDLRADWDIKPWRLTARVTNLFDRHYATYAGYSTAYADYYYYPADPRSLFVSARYTFR